MIGLSILELMTLVGLTAPSWKPWRSMLSVLFGLEPDDRALAQKLTNRTTFSLAPYLESWWIAGRRAGKTNIMSVVIIFLACCRSYVLAVGEVGTVKVICPDRRQAKVLLNYVLGLMSRLPQLAAMIASQTADSITLTNGIVIEIQTANFRSARGYTIVACVIDEIAYLPSEDSAIPDTELLNALRPAMATIPNAMLICISSPYRRASELWRNYKEHFGKDGDPILVVQGASRDLNPALPEAVVAKAYADDPDVASAEYGGQFRNDISGYVAQDVIDAAVLDGTFELEPRAGIEYAAFVDASALAVNGDEYTIAISHNETHVDGRRVRVLDLVRARKGPANTETVTAEFAALVKRYRCHRVTGDRYAGAWVADAWRKCGVDYVASERTASEIYIDFLPLLMSGGCRLLDEKIMLRQLANLERKTERSGKDRVTHPPSGHDDRINVVAGTLTADAGSSAHMVRARGFHAEMDVVFGRAHGYSVERVQKEGTAWDRAMRIK